MRATLQDETGMCTPAKKKMCAWETETERERGSRLAGSTASHDPVEQSQPTGPCMLIKGRTARARDFARRGTSRYPEPCTRCCYPSSDAPCQPSTYATAP